MAKKNVSPDRLRELFCYDAASGAFIRRIDNRRWKAGSVAGTADKDGYTLVCVDGVQYRAHRLAWLYVQGVWPESDIDHMNGDRADNRLANLRDVSRKLNLQNIRCARSDSASGLLGAFRHKRSGLWRSSIRVDGRVISLGYFKTPEEAHNAYNVARRTHYAGCAA